MIKSSDYKGAQFVFIGMAQGDAMKALAAFRCITGKQPYTFSVEDSLETCRGVLRFVSTNRVDERQARASEHCGSNRRVIESAV